MFLHSTETGKMMTTVDYDKVFIYNVILSTITKKYRDITSKPLYINQNRIIKLCNYSTKRQKKEISETKTVATNRKRKMSQTKALTYQ